MRASMATWRTSSFDSGTGFSLGSGRLLTRPGSDQHDRAKARAGEAGGVPTHLAHHRLRVRAAHRLQRAGEHEGFAGEWSIAENLGFRGLDARREELLDERSARTLKVHVDLTRHARADSLDPAQILFGGALQLLDGSEIRRQHRGGRLADLGNAKRVQEMPHLLPAP